MNVHNLASTSVPFTLTTVQVPNLAPTHKKWITVRPAAHLLYVCREIPYMNLKVQCALISYYKCQSDPETHTKRQATKHGCLPRWLGVADKGTEIAWWEKEIFCTGPTRAAKAEQKILVPARQTQGINQHRTPFIFPLWVPMQFQQSASAEPPLSSLFGRT